MKSTKYLFLFMIITLTLPAQAQYSGDNRSLNWIHGFVGSSDSWELFDQYFEAQYGINTIRVDYPSKGGVKKAGSIALTQLLTEGEDVMAIGHSMGGLVVREMISQGAAIDCYATLGTPHQGAYFANSYFQGDVQAFVEDFVDEVFADVFNAAFTPLVSQLILYISDKFGLDDPQMLGDLIFYFVNVAIKQKADDVTIADLRVNGSYIEQLIHPDLPRIAFYGEEDSPVHWRFLSSFMDDTGNDQDLVNKMNQLELVYETTQRVALSTSITCLSWPLNWLPGCALTGLYAGNLATELGQAVNSLQQSEAVWLELIGAIDNSWEECYTESIVVGWDYDKDGDYDYDDKLMRDSCRFSKYVHATGDSILIKLDVDCGDSTIVEEELEPDVRRPEPCRDFVEIIQEREICVRKYSVKESDGFIVGDVTREGGELDWIKFRHLNHQQLRTDPAAMQMLNYLFTNSYYFQDPKYLVFKL